MKTIQFHTKFTFISHNMSNDQETQREDRQLRQWKLIGVGSGWGARDMGTADGPKVLMECIPDVFQGAPKILTYWHKMPLNFAHAVPLSTIEANIHAEHVLEVTTHLCEHTKRTLLEGKTPLVLGGDHSIAIGTWSGVKAALGNDDMGLIWIDAHLDAHIPETSPSSNIHGMPVAVLLGHGDSRFTNIGGALPKLKPNNICLIGIRSFEAGEANLLQELGAKVYMMEEVQERGFAAVFQEARSHIEARRFGLSIDVDAFDPEVAPGTGTPEVSGLYLRDVKEALSGLALDPDFLALEITEFNPHRDQDDKTCHLAWELATLISGDIS
jgi:arginase